ncbi:MAG: MATE family efflux transporter [Aliivibrio sp.]|uniref:MATE family efflux transporter n=1 Tax=Aliivibrio sp. TaxID=1872443 RepID=UPI001A544574|nr:MATE family efflux transporter [Aliivibrio sp.]
MTWPMMFGILSLMSFQLVDSAFIGQLGVLPLAAQGFTMPMQMVIIGLQVGLGIATTSVISRVIGANQITRAKQLGGLVIVVGAVGVILICLLIWFSRGLILNLLGAPENVFPVIDGYWPSWLLSAWAGAMLYFAYSLCRSNGNTMLPGIMMVATSIMNMVLDPIFIFTFDLGLPGAAWATVVSFSIGLLVVYPTVYKRAWMSFQWHDLDVKRSVKELTGVMAPAMMSQLLPPVSSMFATKLIASFGATAIAGWALASRIEFFSIVTVLALTMSMPPMIGRMLGAKECDKIQVLVNIAVKFVLVLQLTIAAILFMSSGLISDLMSSNAQVSEVLAMYLVWGPISLGSLGVCMLMVSICNALGMPMRALLISSLRLFVCFLPMLWLGATFAGIQGLFIGAMAGNLAAGVMAWVMYRQAIKRTNKALVSQK